MNDKLSQLRRDYASEPLIETDVFEDPFRQFNKWMQEAIDSEVLEPNAMVLATATKDGYPSARTVLLKGVDEEGFRFFTNMGSRKGDEIAENPRVALVFNWLELARQVRIEGLAYPLPDKEAEAYFQQRPKASQIGATVSPQSKVVNRGELEAEFNRIEAQYANEAFLPKPPKWGGYLVKPFKIELWQGRMARLHDRLCYTLVELTPQKRWKLERIAP